MDNFVDINTTYSEILHEEVKVVDSTEKSIRSNYFLTKPQGIIIQDSWNNFLFPIRPEPVLDTRKCDLPKLWKYYRQYYTSFKSNFLPWHYVIEFIEGRYIAFNTRPINIRFPVKHQEALKQKDDIKFGVQWDEATTDFMDKKIFLLEEAIHVCILGNSELDVYPKNFYKVLGDIAVKPFIHLFRLPNSSRTRTFALNMGQKFNQDYLFKFLYSQ